MLPHLIRSKMVGYPPAYLAGRREYHSHGYYGPHRSISPRIKGSEGGSAGSRRGIPARPHWEHALVAAGTRRPGISKRGILRQSRVVQPWRVGERPPRTEHDS